MTVEHPPCVPSNSSLSRVPTKPLRAALVVFVGQLGLLACGQADDATTEPAVRPSPDSGAPHAPIAVPIDTGLAAYSEPGAYRAGFRLINAAASELAAKVWYPTLDDGDAGGNAIEYAIAFKADYYGAETGTIWGHALRGASVAPTQEPFPVVVFSHGFALNPEWYSALIEHLASRGFVVVAPEHEESDWDTTVIDATFERPAQVRRSIDLAEAMNASDNAFLQTLDLQRLAVVGHSYGGYTALATAGARFDVEGLKSRCAELDPMDPKAYLCHPFVSEEDALQRLAAASKKATSPLADSRVKAIVTIAGDAYLFGEEGLASVSVPTLAVGGTFDNWSPWDWGAELTYLSVGSSRVALAGLEGADHMIAVDTCDDLPWTDALPPDFSSVLCQDPLWDRADALALVRSLVTAFLLDTLGGDTQAHNALSSEAVTEANVRYASSW